jgi:hypothetical protein
VFYVIKCILVLIRSYSNKFKSSQQIMRYDAVARRNEINDIESEEGKGNPLPFFVGIDGRNGNAILFLLFTSTVRVGWLFEQVH